ncbi:preprotein translocase subunit SecG [Candidatus Dojkabacteria bacterium]|nr:preprotein translocase subunit SecG [Candidatus Dojkabacteria bacterium]
MKNILLVSEIIVSALLVIVIVLQPKNADVGTLFGGGFGDEVKRTKRGFELFLHNATIFLTVFFAAIAIAFMFVSYL